MSEERESAEEVGLRVMRQLAEYFGITDHPDVFVDKQAASIVAAAIREDRAEPVSDGRSEEALEDAAIQLESRAYDLKDMYDKFELADEIGDIAQELRLRLEAARQARATADEKGGAR